MSHAHKIHLKRLGLPTPAVYIFYLILSNNDLYLYKHISLGSYRVNVPFLDPWELLKTLVGYGLRTYLMLLIVNLCAIFYLLKTSENVTVFWSFQEIKMEHWFNMGKICHWSFDYHVKVVLSIVVVRKITHPSYSTRSETLQHVYASYFVSFVFLSFW